MKRFKRIYIEITNVCNLSCSFCPRTKRKPSFMGVETFSNILDKIEPYTDYIYLHVKGEPLLHPELDEILDISYEKGFKVNITTNGTLINKVRDKLINKPALRQINFSLHSFEGKDSVINKSEYINNILSFTKEITDKSETIVALRLWNLDKDNEVNSVRNRNNELLRLLETEFNLKNPIEDKLNPGKGIRLAERVYLNHDHEFTWPDLKEDEDDGIGTCYGLRSQIAILVDGTIVPCCLDGEGVINLGNVCDVDFLEVLESERVKEIIKGFTERRTVEELCRKCGYRKRFG